MVNQLMRQCPNLSTEQKSEELESIGFRFRRDVVIPDKLNKLNDLIETSKIMLTYGDPNKDQAFLLRESIKSMEINAKNLEAEKVNIT